MLLVPQPPPLIALMLAAVWVGVMLGALNEILVVVDLRCCDRPRVLIPKALLAGLSPGAAPCTCVAATSMNQVHMSVQ